MEVSAGKIVSAGEMRIYMLVSLEDMDDRVNDNVTEGAFRSLCLMANAFAMLQVERHTTPNLRAKISDATPGSEVLEIVRKVKKQSFFRAEAGGIRHPSPLSESDEDDFGERTGKKKNDVFKGSQRLYPQRRRRRKSGSPRFGGRRFFYPRQRLADGRFMQPRLRAEAPPP
jgi:hypothetical protein